VRPALEDCVGVNHGAFSGATRQQTTVLHSENARIADSVQHGEHLPKVDVAAPWLLAAGRIGKLDVTEHVARLDQQPRQVLPCDFLLVDVEQQPARRTADGPAQLGRLIRGAQKQPRRIRSMIDRLQ